MCPFVPSLGSCLRHPCQQLQAFDDTINLRSNRESFANRGGPRSQSKKVCLSANLYKMQSASVSIPYRLWAQLTALAVGGSLLYGASLSLLFRKWRPERSSLWLALSAGGGWCLFGPLLVLVTRRRVQTCVQACLTTMAYGEAVLISGACINVWLGLKGTFREVALARWNVALVGISNLVMVTALTRQLRHLGVPAWKTLLSWMFVLNGSSVFLFFLLRRLL